ncbi:hypothetical protein HBH56_152100 [Parastagonospora nodorum]|uniref:RING-type domain-containing protein n=2 Tax=Phaeosphaeria nodorum (strain SN15 / ATCC MYA-4574 / FGSC 10173) TaxID=321614 RepID=A0A7U2EZR1_PHANO|nr:hypothetical protein SNOG_05752 [Parastagonospora nodorum SN15]KAH3909774.1 hypothetical protein HBH56_152100 [Parastagonospora nodorum]EAT86816.1 hypothetical protein SNOG_05752 [Parastagonospora nodorum SN15]KAH3926699.1 hypothetical protein HBH54_165580 [Parastagonospora nodorum]KAH4134866.1 hypothetical protein HBH45_160530 [Parastagonospora nodorum]KAH4154897.1 hypothetical protein HBH44_139730 [Parastagonospora nodorum]
MSDRDPNVGFDASYQPAKLNPQDLEINMTSGFNNTAAAAHQAQQHHPFRLPALYNSTTNAPHTSLNPYHLHMPRHAGGRFDHYESHMEGPYQALSRGYGVDRRLAVQAPSWYENSPLNLAVEEDMPIGGFSQHRTAPAQATQHRMHNHPAAIMATKNALESEHAHSTPHMRHRATQTTVNVHPLPTGQDSMYRAQHYPSSNLQGSEQPRPSEHEKLHTANRLDNGAESLRFCPLPYELRTPIWADLTEPTTAHTGVHPRGNWPSTTSLQDQGFTVDSFLDLGFNEAFQQPVFQGNTNSSVLMVPYTGQSSFFYDAPQDFRRPSQPQSSRGVDRSLSAAHSDMESAPTSFDPLPPADRRSFMQAMEYATATTTPLAHQQVRQDHGASSRLSADNVERVAASANGAQSQGHVLPTPVVMGPIRTAQRVPRSGPRRPPNPAQVQHFTTLLADDACHDKECPICQDPYNDSDHPAIRMQHVPCDHVFGLKCIQEWVNSGMQNAHLCPSCRQSITGALSRGSQGRSNHRAAVPPRRRPRAGTRMRSQRVSAVDAPRATGLPDPLAAHADAPRTNTPRPNRNIQERFLNLQRTQGLPQQATTSPPSLSVPATALLGQPEYTQLEQNLFAQRQDLATFDGAAARLTARSQALSHEDAIHLAAQLSRRRTQLLSRHTEHYMAESRKLQRGNRERADEHAALRH